MLLIFCMKFMDTKKIAYKQTSSLLRICNGKSKKLEPGIDWVWKEIEQYGFSQCSISILKDKMCELLFFHCIGAATIWEHRERLPPEMEKIVVEKWYYFRKLYF